MEPKKYDVEGRLFHEHMRPGNVNEETEKDILSLSATNIIWLIKQKIHETQTFINV